MDELKQYLENAFMSFANDPADTDYQAGYLAAIDDVLTFVNQIIENSS